MDATSYAAYTERVVAWAVSNPTVLGLVALGSMAEQGRTPDEWSDHDFWVVVQDGAAERLRTAPDWLPDPDRIVLFFRETDHGVKAVYDDGHLLEPAIFEVEELSVTRANEYRVLVDKMDLADRMEAIAASTHAETSTDDPTDEFLFRTVPHQSARRHRPVGTRRARVRSGVRKTACRGPSLATRQPAPPS